MNLMIKGRMAQEASTILSMLDTDKKIEALIHIAKLLRESSNEILSANAIDVEKAIEKGVKDSLVDRLRLTEARIDAMAEGLEQITQLEDPVGTVLAQWKRPNGLRIRKVRVPFGVIGIILQCRSQPSPVTYRRHPGTAGHPQSAPWRHRGDGLCRARG